MQTLIDTKNSEVKKSIQKFQDEYEKWIHINKPLIPSQHILSSQSKE